MSPPCAAAPAVLAVAAGLTAEQAALLEAVREATRAFVCRQPHLAGDASLLADHFLLRFLRARQWHKENVLKMLMSHLSWMQEKNVIGLLSKPFPELALVKRFYPTGFHGTDKMGRPIYIDRVGKLDMARLMQHVTQEQVVENYIRDSERQIRLRFPACSLARGEVVDRSLNIVDLSGLSFGLATHSMAKRVVKEMMTVSQDHYPETCGQTLIINCPQMFYMVWATVKSWLDEVTVRRIKVVDKERTTQALLEIVDADQLPAFLGGRCECQCEGGCLSSNKGPWQRSDVVAHLAADPDHHWQALTPEGCRALLQEAPPKEAAASAVSAVAVAPAAAAADAAAVALAAGAPTVAGAPAAATSAAGVAVTLAASAVVPASALGAAAATAAPTPPTDVTLVAEATQALATVPAAPAAAAPAEAARAATVPASNAAPATAPAAVAPATPTEARLDSEELSQQAVAPHEMEARQRLVGLEAKRKAMEAEILEILVDWAHVYRQLVAELGRATIERAQSYYDAHAVVERLQEELDSARASAANLGEQFDLLQSHHKRAEDAFHAYLEDPSEASISEEEWRHMLPEKPECPEDFRADGKLLRAWRMSALSDAVAVLRRPLTRARAEQARAEEECKAARELLSAETAKHSYCTWNCSVRRAQAFYERRRAHELEVNHHARNHQVLEDEIAVAMLVLEAAAASGAESPLVCEVPCASASSRKDLTTADYEMEEFFDCCESGDEGQNSGDSGGET